MDSRPVLRIFISSTAIDLLDYRDKVRDAVLSLGSLPVAMETFSAQSGQPAGECVRMAAEADAVICIVAHRYGYVPPRDLGGDGEHSITWLEVDAARHAGKPVFAFIVDPKAPWTEIKEQDRLIAEPERAPEIVKAVQRLQEFKASLNREYTRQTFTNPDDLAKHVMAALANFKGQADRAITSTVRIWQPLFCHALQPALHFRGREAKSREIKEWLESAVTPDRVISIVAAGGTGKTALVDKALREARFSHRSGLFVWSFYEDPHTDAFLRAAYLYFTDERETPSGGMLERLQLALSGDAPHVLVLDGLERVQNETDHGRRGELNDAQVKRLVRAIAGGIGNVRAIVTSRFPLVDLEEWTGAGHHTILLDGLEQPVALEVLRAWGVRGEDEVLVQVLEPLQIQGFYHALSISVLGSYIANFYGGDSSFAPTFSLEEASDGDPRARRLTRILEHYIRVLSSIERDLLARLSLFPRGVKVELLSWIVQSGGEVAGSLVGLGETQVTKHLERLRALGLVFRYVNAGQALYSAHPFLREFFRGLLGQNRESIHESVRARLAPTLEARPRTWPSDPAMLDQYELLIEQTIMAGRVREAFELYWYGLGAYGNLGWVLGENTRSLRILELFIAQDEFSSIEHHMPARDRAILINALGLFAKNLGNLERARSAFRYSSGQDQSVSDLPAESVGNQNLAEVELHAGLFPSALDYAETALALAMRAEDETQIADSLGCRATVNFALGNIARAEIDYQRATELGGEPLYIVRGTHRAECSFLCGDRTRALIATQANRQIAKANGWNANACRCDAFLVRLVLSDDPARAALHLEDARVFANRSGVIELQLRCFHAACEFYRHLGNYQQALTEANSGILLSNTYRFGKYSIELLISLAETYLATGKAQEALRNARKALDLSQQPDCLYAWGEADGLHFCGVAHLHLGERNLAIKRLSAALECRDRIHHGRIGETHTALELARA